ncbi:RNA polymerase sigma factor [uncultured Microbulbifer sp.]|uniref:RNA polymerase sigma factor n=1 Tax=uncultured Microbulbifer sp. TaxID=348147 RepID=UPI00262EE6F8|nr:RNA polymerase sigma factor [uncultured Microbulbifer sp.]
METAAQLYDRNRIDKKNPAQGAVVRRMEQFLASVEKRAFSMASMAVGNRDDALDIVQDAMFALVRRYSHKQREQWRPLFFTILNNRITDWHRRHKTVSRWQLLKEKFARGDGDSEEIDFDPGTLEDTSGSGPEQRAFSQHTLEVIEAAVGRLPPRQQQAFLLRCVEGFDNAETATAMCCSAGSVKTHLSRALTALRVQLEEVR